MNQSRVIIGVMAVVVAIFMAIGLGYGVVTSRWMTLAQLGAGVVFFVCIGLGRRIWLLIPLFGAMGFTLAIPGSPSSDMLAQMLVIGFSLILLLMRKLEFRIVFSEIELWILLFTISVVQVYMRNPVGLNILGGSAVGGRPYAIFALNLATALLFLGLRVPEKELKLVFPLSIAGSLISLALSIFGYFVPSIGAYYGAVMVTGDRQVVQHAEGEATRVGFLGNFARNLALWISSVISPLKACFSVKFAPLVLISMAAAAGSGFRNIIISTGLTYLLGIWYRSGFGAVVVSCLMAALGVTGLAIVNLVTPLPANVQRSLTFLPGSWDERYMKDAEGSTEWRVVMWKEALFTPNWIENKILGDGLGMSQREYRWMQSLDQVSIGGDAGSGNLTLQQEIMLITGGYHSGPVSAVRTVGYVGLIVILCAFVRLCVHAHRQIQRARGTAWLPLAMFVGLQMIVSSLFWVFIYGTFTGAVGAILLTGSMVRFLDQNLPLPAWKRPYRGHLPLVTSQRLAPAQPPGA